jgi:hypothetical protein
VEQELSVPIEILSVTGEEDPILVGVAASQAVNVPEQAAPR